MSKKNVQSITSFVEMILALCFGIERRYLSLDFKHSIDLASILIVLNRDAV